MLEPFLLLPPFLGDTGDTLFNFLFDNYVRLDAGDLRPISSALTGLTRRLFPKTYYC